MTVSTEIRKGIIDEINSGIVKLLGPIRPIQPTEKKFVPPTIIERTSTEKRRMAMVFARQLMRHGGLSFGDAQRYAWNELKQLPDARLLVFWKVDRKTGKRTKVSRIVEKNWRKYYTPTGTGHPLKENQILLADVARIQCGIRPLISTYIDRIIECI